MANDPRLLTYLGSGALAGRPAAPSIASGMIGWWYSTDTHVVSFWDGTGAAWHDTGYTAGTLPTVVQTAFSVGGGNSAVFGVAPTNGNLLVAMLFNPTNNTAGAGWARVGTNSTGTDFGSVMTKTAGAGESTTQTPGSGIGAAGGIVIWEIAGALALLLGQSQVETTATAATIPVPLPNVKTGLGLSAVAVVTGVTIAAGYNVGTQDVLDNSGSRCLLAGHTDMSQTPTAGLLARLSGSGSSKSATALVVGA